MYYILINTFVLRNVKINFIIRHLILDLNNLKLKITGAN